MVLILKNIKDDIIGKTSECLFVKDRGSRTWGIVVNENIHER